MLRKLAINTSILLILAGCKAPQFKEPIYRRVYSAQFGCMIQKYSLNQVKNLENFYEVDESYCDDLVGFSASDWAKHITPTGKEILQYGKDECN